MNYTTNYQLNQWELHDRVMMQDFNSDNAKIDAALKAVDSRVDGLTQSKADASALAALSQSAAEKTRLAFGSYTGNGAASRFISTGFTPKAVLVMGTDGGLTGTNPTGSDPVYGDLAVSGQPSVSSGGAVKIVNGGFNVVCKGYVQSNQQSRYYNYIALG